MMTERTHSAEDDYFRNQEAERRLYDDWDLQRTARAEQAARAESDARRARQGVRADADTAPQVRRVARRGLNRLIIAGYGEVLALDEAARIVLGADARRSLVQKAEQRRVFRHDLSSAVVTLGGVPARGISLSTLGSAWARRLRRWATGPHQGDAYHACARAAEITSDEYAAVLRSNLPFDVRFGLEHQQAVIELDRQELRRLRWGASAAPA